MKVLFLSGDRSIATPHSPARSRQEAYARLLGELHVVLRGQKTRSTTDGALTIHEVKTSKLWYPLVFRNAAKRVIWHENIDVVSAQDPFEMGIAAYLATRGTTAKLHLQLHTDFLTPGFLEVSGKGILLNRLRRTLADFTLPRAAGIRVVSERVKRSLLARYGSRIVEPSVIPVTIPEPRELSSTIEKPFPITILAVGYLRPEKRVGDILKALARVAHKDAGLVIAGDGPERSRLEATARKLGLSARVHFLGARSDVSTLMRAADIFVQASAFEGYGLSLIEAAYAGLAIATSDVGIVGDVLANEESALVSPVGDVEALGANLNRLLTNPVLRAQLGAAAKAAATSALAHSNEQPVLIARDLERLVSGSTPHTP